MPDRVWVGRKPPDDSYLFDLLSDYNLTTAIHNLWPNLERILLATQRNCARGSKPAICEAVDEVFRDLKMFADQGKLDLDYIKSLA